MRSRIRTNRSEKFELYGKRFLESTLANGIGTLICFIPFPLFLFSLYVYPSTTSACNVLRKLNFWTSAFPYNLPYIRQQLIQLIPLIIFHLFFSRSSICHSFVIVPVQKFIEKLAQNIQRKINQNIYSVLLVLVIFIYIFFIFKYSK